MTSDPSAREPYSDRESLERDIASLRTYLLKVAHGLAGGPARRGEYPSDLVQQAIKSALVDIQNGKCHAEDARQLRAWVRRILISKYYDSLRAAARVGPFDPLTDLPDDGTSPSGEALDREQTALLHQALERLTPRDRQLLSWRQDEDLTFQEIGQRLGLGLHGARRAFLRAGQRLRAAYEDLAGPQSARGREGPP